MHYNSEMTVTRVIIAVLAVVLIVSAIWAFTKQQAVQPVAPPATTPPDQDADSDRPVPADGWSGDAVNFTYTSADGNTYTADKRFAGKPLVVNFWAAW